MYIQEIVPYIILYHIACTTLLVIVISNLENDFDAITKRGWIFFAIILPVWSVLYFFGKLIRWFFVKDDKY